MIDQIILYAISFLMGAMFTAIYTARQDDEIRNECVKRLRYLEDYHQRYKLKGDC